MDCPGSLLGFATNTTIKCPDAWKLLKKNWYMYAIYEMGLVANGVKSKEHHQIWDTLS